MSRFRRHWIVTVILTLPLLAAAAGFYGLVATETGSRWLVGAALDRVGDRVEMTSFRGTLASGVVIEDLKLQRPGTDVGLKRLESRWRLWDLLAGQFTVDKLVLENLHIRLSTTSAKTKPARWPSLAVPVAVTLRHGRIDGLTVINGDQALHLDSIAVEGSTGALHWRFDRLSITGGNRKLALEGRIGNRFPFTMKLDADWRWDDYKGAGSLSGDVTALNFKQALVAPFTASTRGRLDTGLQPEAIAADPEQFQLDGEARWQGAPLPAVAGETSLADGRLTLTGRWQDYRFDLDGTLRWPSGARLSTNVAVAGTGSDRELVFSHLALTQGNNGLTAAGRALLAPPFDWDMEIRLTRLDLAPYLPDWPAVLSGRLASSGRWQAGDYRIGLQLQEVRGQLRGRAIDGRGRLDISPDHYRARDLRLAVGDNRLSLDGAVAADTRLDWQLDAQRLSTLHPAFAGSLSGSGNVSGNPNRPRILLTLTGRDLAFRDWRADAVSLDLKPRADDQYQLTLQADRLDMPGITGGRLLVEGRGDLERHELALTLERDDVDLDARLQGGLAGERNWQGRVQQLRVQGPALGQWQLRRAAALNLAPATVSLDRLCLESSHGNFCGLFRLEGERVQTDGELQGLPLALAEHWLPAATELDGRLDARWALAGAAAQLEGTFRLQTRDAAVRQLNDDGETLLERQWQLAMDGDLSTARLRGAGTLTVAETGELSLALSVAEPLGAGRLSGAVSGGFDNLSWLDPLVPGVDRLDGELSTALALDGTLRAPAFNGRIALEKLTGQIPTAALQIDDGQATLTLGSDRGWQLDGQLRAGEGRLGIAGRGAGLTAASLTGKLSVTGSRFPLFNRPDLKARVSPDLAVAVDPDTVSITGLLRVDEGRLAVKTLGGGGVPVSPDETVQGPDGNNGGNDGRKVKTAIDLVLTDFRFEGRGLTARLAGELALRQNGNSPPRARGTIDIVEGLYKAYGQKLSVRDGQLIFQGPLDDPGLAIVAVRETPYADVGVRISGSASDIRGQLFSEPELPPTEAMAILVTGKPLESVNQSEANQMANAAAALGISQSEWITTRLQESFGLDVVTLKGGEDYTESSLVVGKYLTPKLFVDYVQSLFVPEGSVGLEYTLSDKISLEARSGAAQSVDLLFRFEH